MITIPAPSGPTADADVDARPRADQSLLDAVTDLRRDVDAVRLPLPLDGVDEAEESRRRLLDQLDDHLLPRLRELSAPAVVVVAGSTGAGKSTLVNSLLRDEVTTAGVLRPTTRRPVLVHHPDDGDLLSAHPLMEVVRVVAHPAVPRGLTLLDAPDLDSLEESNRATAHRLLEAADLWVFVTTAARYGDALPWQYLQRAADRGTSMAMVLNRVPAAALTDVRADLMTRLREHGMSAVPLFLVPDVGPHEGLLDATKVAPINRWLAMVAGPDRARSVIVRTQRGALKALRPWADTLVAAVQAQVDARARLEAVVGAAEEAAQGVAATDTALLAEGPVRGAWEAR
ncbi:dynamin family protein, partial [Cellulomonas bogoriensis]|uniref:dynamin family protein n=1 Tax=Cellulomonas bogoriensis TaxID=301388 RepID=UPI0018DE4A3B